MPVAPLLSAALLIDGVGVTIGAAAATGRWPPSRRWMHHAAYAGTTACMLGAVAASRTRRDAAATLPALVALAALPRTRPGTPAHIGVAALATCCLAAGRAAVRLGVSGSPPTGDRTRGG